MPAINVNGVTYMTVTCGTMTEILINGGEYSVIAASNHTSLMQEIEGDNCVIESTTEVTTVENAVTWALGHIADQ